ncbi:unnamed protein product [Mesocestoides corti]|uniref:Uncharacterized protein n=1 Tax=Mesocestoides corti TaxID=53468 RepID=A0A0R3URI2_MESCO|nr:unnamed protein product [Mesocestoides corti]
MDFSRVLPAYQGTRMGLGGDAVSYQIMLVCCNSPTPFPPPPPLPLLLLLLPLLQLNTAVADTNSEKYDFLG